MDILPARMPVYHVCTWCPLRSGIGSFENWSYGIESCHVFVGNGAQVLCENSKGI